jgi:uncharacterized protein
MNILAPNTCSFASVKAVAHFTKERGRAIVCVAPIKKDEVVAIIGGELLPLIVALTMEESQKSQCLQVEEDYVLWISHYTQSTADWFNHSCAPNVGVSGQISFIAMRDIAAGEELCYDYAMSDGSSIDEFECNCGAPNCRKTVTGNDWQKPELQKAYAGYFMPYLARRIEKLHKNQEFKLVVNQ